MNRWDAGFIDDAIARVAKDQQYEFFFECVGQPLQRQHQEVGTLERALHGLGAEDQDFFILWNSEELAGEIFVDRLIDIRVDAVGNVANIESGQHALPHQIAQPFAGGDDGEL